MAIRNVLREVYSDGRDVTVMGIHLSEAGREVAPARKRGVAGEHLAGRDERKIERAGLASSSPSRVSRAWSPLKEPPCLK